MSVKIILVLCAQALFIQSAFSYCVSGGNYGAGLSGFGLGVPTLATPTAAMAGSSQQWQCGAGLGYGAGAGYGGIEVIPTSGGGLSVSSVSAFAPSGLSVASENVYEGALSVAGELPLVSAVALEGVLPSAGTGAISYSCGNGVTAIESIAPSAAAANGPGVAAYGPEIASSAPAAAIAPGFGFGSLASRGCGCGI